MSYDSEWLEGVLPGDVLPDFIIASPKLEFQPIIGFYEV